MQAAITSPQPKRIETEVRRIRALLERSEFSQAHTAAQALRAEVPENRDALYMLAVAQRYSQRIPDALATLAKLEKHHPRYGRLFQERGHCYVAVRAAEPAIEAYVRAVELNSSLPASWNALEKLFRMTDRAADASNAAGHMARLAALPPEVVTAFSMYADGEIIEAEDLIRRFLLTHGNHVEAMRLLAKIGLDLDVADDAEFLLENALLLAPEHQILRYEYALVLLKRHKHVQAREQMEVLL